MSVRPPFRNYIMGQGQSISRGGLPSLDELGGYNRPPVLLKDELDTKMTWMGESLGADASRYQQSMETGRGGNTGKQRMMLGMCGQLSKSQSRRIKFDPLVGDKFSDLSKVNEQWKIGLTDSDGISSRTRKFSLQGDSREEEEEEAPRRALRRGRISFGGGGGGGDPKDDSSRKFPDSPLMPPSPLKPPPSPLKPPPSPLKSPASPLKPVEKIMYKVGLDSQKSAPPSLWEGKGDIQGAMPMISPSSFMGRLRTSETGHSSPAEASSPSAFLGMPSQRRAEAKAPMTSLLCDLASPSAEPSKRKSRRSEPGHLSSTEEKTLASEPRPPRKSLEGGTIHFPKLGRRERTERIPASPMKDSILSVPRKSMEPSYISSSVNDSSESLAARITARRLALLGWKPPKTVAQIVEEERQLHWRLRVKNAKMRLYWYLRGYMAWFSILKRVRKGYADAFIVEDLPLYLQKILGQKMKGPFLSAMALSHANQLAVIANRVNARWIESHASGHSSSDPRTPPTPSSFSAPLLPSLNPMQSTLAQGEEVSPKEGSGSGWFAPAVVNANFLSFEGAHPAHMEHDLVQTMAQGAIACQLIYLGDQLAQDREGGTKKAAIEVDLWAEIASLDPNKLPNGIRRLEGLTLLDRGVLQLLSSVEKISKTAHALANLHLIICVDGESTDFVTQQITLRCHWGLNPLNVLVVSIACFPGMIWDANAKKIALQYLSDDVPYISAGSGFALLSMAWPSESFRVEDKQRVYLSGSAFSSLIADNVDYIYSISLSDLENLNPSTALDSTFLSPALYMMRNHHDAQIAIEVIQSPNESIIRQQGNIVLAGAPSPSIFCSVLSRTDLMTQPTRALVDQMAMRTSCTGRYFIKVKEMVKMIKGPSSFRPDLKLVTTNSGKVATYLTLDMADLTSCQSNLQIASRCVAVAGRSPGRDSESRLISPDILLAAIPYLVAQESQAVFKKRAAPLLRLDHSCPVTHMKWNLQLNGSNSQELEAKKSPVKRKGCKILLLVKESYVCRRAFRLCRSLIGQEEGDSLLIMTLKEPSSQGFEEGEKLLRTFSHFTTDHLTTRVVGELISDRLVKSLITSIEKVDPDLVVIGSETLANSGSASFNAATSTCYAMSKAPLLQSILIVKTNSSGALFSLSTDALAGEAGALKVAIEVHPQLSMLSWMLQRCSAGRDKIALFRREPPSRPGPRQEEITAARKHSERLLASFENEVTKRRFKMARKLFLSSEAGPLAQDQALRTFVVNEKCDLVVLAGGGRDTQPHILDLLLGCKSSVMIQRQLNEDSGSVSAFL